MATVKIEKQLFNRVESAAYLGVAKNTLDRLLNAGNIQYEKNGRRIFIPKKALDNYIDRILQKEVK